MEIDIIFALRKIKMKNIKLMSFVAILGLGSIIATSCGDVEEVTPKPTIEFIGGSEYVSSDISLAGGSNFTVGLNISHTLKLQKLEITVSYDGEPEVLDPNCTLCDTLLGDNDLRVDFKGTTRAAKGTEAWNFTATDKDGNSTTKTITITNLGSGGSALIEFTQDNNGDPFRVWNFAGARQGAYQLGVGNLSSSEPNKYKDIQDSVSSTEIGNKEWPARWTSRNGTMFKKSTSYNWSSVNNSSELEAAWNALGTAESVVEVTDGDVYIVNIKNAGTYALVEITDVKDTGASDNNDYVQFRYKK